MDLFKKIQIKIRPGKEFVRELLYKIGIKYNTVYIISGDVLHNSPDINPEPSVQIGLASREQMLGLKIGDVQERLLREDVCFLAFIDGQLAGYAWLNISGNAYITEIEQYLPLGKGEAYQYDALVFSQFRRRNLHKLLIAARLVYLRQHGFRKVYGFISAGNIVSLKSVRSFGYVAEKKIRFLKIFSFRKWREVPLEKEYRDYVS